MRGLGDRPQAVVDVGDRLRVALAARVGGDLVHRARAVERDERDEVLELGRLDLLERLAHALGLELEHAHRVAAGHHLVGLLVVERQLRHVDPLPLERSMIASVSSITSRLRRPRKSIFSRPISSIGFIENWVTVR